MKRWLFLLVLISSAAFATVTNQSVSVTFSCSGSTGPYPFSFPISDSSALTVTQDGVVLSTSAYTVTAVNNNFANGGSVTLNTVCNGGSTLVLSRVTPVTQTTVYTDNMPIPMKTFEKSLDKLTEIAIEQDANLSLVGNWLCPAGQIASSFSNFLPQCVPVTSGGTGTYNTVQVGTGSANGSIVPRLFSVLDGSSGSYLTGQTANTPTTDFTRWEGTPQFATGYNWYGLRGDCITKASTDVQSGVCLQISLTANSTDAANAQSNTAQTAITGNASGSGTGASAPLEGINAIADSTYTFGGSPVPQNVIAMEADYVAATDGAAFNATTGPFGVGVLASNNGNTGGTVDGTFGVLARGIVANNGWKTGGYFTGRLAGLVVGRENFITPDAGLWIRNATTYGIYIGGTRDIESSTYYNSTMTKGNAATALELGETGATSTSSGVLQFDSTDGSSVRHATRLFADNAGGLQLYYDGNPKFYITKTGASVGLTFQSTQTTGTAPFTVASTTPVANLTAVPTTYNHSGTQATGVHIVADACTLGTSCSVTLVGSAVFTSSSSYFCTATDETAAAAVKFVPSSGSAFALTGTGTDVLSYVCVGN